MITITMPEWFGYFIAVLITLWIIERLLSLVHMYLDHLFRKRWGALIKAKTNKQETTDA